MEPNKGHSSIIHFQDEDETYKDLPITQTVANLSSNSSGISSSQAFSNLSLDSTSNYALSSCISFSASESENEEPCQDKTVKFRRNSFGNDGFKGDPKRDFTRQWPNSFEENLHHSTCHVNNTGPKSLTSKSRIRPILKKTPSLDAAPYPYTDYVPTDVNRPFGSQCVHDEVIKLKGILKNKGESINTQHHDLLANRHHFQSTDDISVRFTTACQLNDDTRTAPVYGQNFRGINRPKSTSLDYAVQGDGGGGPLNCTTLKGILKNKSQSGSQQLPLLPHYNQKVPINMSPPIVTSPNVVNNVDPANSTTTRRSILKSRYYGSKSLPGIHIDSGGRPGILKRRPEPGSALKSNAQPVAYSNRRLSNPLFTTTSPARKTSPAPKGILKKSEAGLVSCDLAPRNRALTRNVYIDSVVASTLEKALRANHDIEQPSSALFGNHHHLPGKSILKNKKKTSS